MSSKGVKSFLLNLKSVVSVNLLSLVYSLLILILLPNVLNLEQFGYWQLYLFYANFIGFLHFGINDGIYLRYGGERYEDLNKSLLLNQLKILILIQIVVVVIGFQLNLLFTVDETKYLVINLVLFLTILINLRYYFLYILQASNLFKKYSLILTVERVLLFLTVGTMIAVGYGDFSFYIIADLFSKFLSLLVALYLCRDLIYSGEKSNKKLTKNDIHETKLNISSGSKLMIANLSSILIIGVVRFGIENNWDIETFGQISLALNISMFMLVFFNAIGMVIFPMLRRKNNDDLEKIYSKSTSFFLYLSGFLLIIYYLIPLFLRPILQSYQLTFEVLPLIFPIIIYEAKMAVISNNYLKTIRKESLMLKINLLTLLLSFLLTYLTAYYLKNLYLSIFVILLVVGIKSIATDYFLAKIMKVNTGLSNSLQTILIVVFAFTNLFMSPFLSFVLILSFISIVTILYLEKIIDMYKKYKKNSKRSY